MVRMINVVIFNNFGIGIWNVYIVKEVKFLRYIISFKKNCYLFILQR